MSEPIARIRIELEGTDPLVWRELDLPLSTTLATLHDLIQVAMRWQSYYLFEQTFLVFLPSSVAPTLTMDSTG